jgi:hypothetical protein
MREHPWNVRRVTHRHLHDHRNLLDLHFLTHAWTSAAQTGDTASLSNPFDKEPTLEDDTSPEDVLLRLEQAVLATQFEALSNRLKAKPTRREAAALEPSATLSALDELSLQAGRECAERRWPKDAEELTPLAPMTPGDRRKLLAALYHSPLAGRWGPDAFLVRRALISEVSVELLNCPHCKSSEGRADAATVAALCQQQFHWLRGYLGHLNPAITPQIERQGGRCVVRW